MTIEFESQPRLIDAHDNAIARGAKCLECPLFGCQRGPVMGLIRPNAKLAIVGEAPGFNEVAAGEPFVGPSGAVLNEALLNGDVRREDVTITNTLLCQPHDVMDAYLTKMKYAAEKEGRPFISPIDCCHPRLQRDLQESNSTVELAVGNYALAALAKHHNIPYGSGQRVDKGQLRIATLRKQHGAPIVLRDEPRKVLLASYHPAFALRGAKAWLPIISKVITRAALIANRGGEIDWTEPAFNINPTLSDLQQFVETAKREKAVITCDIETDSAQTQTCVLRCVGLGMTINSVEHLICVPFHNMDGSMSPPDGPGTPIERFEAARSLISDLLDSCILAGQNFSFDTSVLLRLGFMTKAHKRWYCCYAAERTQFLTRSGWKSFDEVEDGELLGTINKFGQLEWQVPTARFDQQYTGQMYTFETQRTKCIVTANHRMYTRPFWRASGRRGEFSWTPADELSKASPDVHEIYRAFSLATSNNCLDTRWFMLLGLYISEGTLRWYRNRPRGILIAQKRGGKASKVLDKLLVDGFFDFKSTYKRVINGKVACVQDSYVADGQPDIYVACGRYSRDRCIPRSCFEASHAERRALLEGLMLGDGHRGRRKAWLYCTYSNKLADDVQLLALTLGYPATIHRAGDSFIVSIRTDLDAFEKMSPRVNTNGMYRHAKSTHVVNQRVVCFSVPNETLVTRCDNKVAMHGNTMLAHHDTDSNDLPHGLGFIVSEYFEAPHHKEDADHKVVDNVDFDRLKEYNMRDVLCTMRLVDATAERVSQLGTWPQLELDLKLAPVCRDMGDLGLVIDERERRRLHSVLAEKCEYFKAQFKFNALLLTVDPDAADRLQQHIAGTKEGSEERLVAYQQLVESTKFVKFNPRSTKQIGEWLFSDLSLTPQLNTEGYEYDDESGDTPGTGQAALLKLQEKYPHVNEVVDSLLEMRAYDKLLGTYVADRSENIRNVDWTKWGMPHCDWLRILNTIYKLHIIPSGRLSTQPAVQNWPAVGKGNMRTMVVSPPGHCIVGADYDQLELRIYAIVAQDKLLLQAFQEGLDPHSLNAAVLLSKNEAEIMDQYRRINGAPAKERKYWRTVAKRFVYLETYGGEEDKLFSTMAASRDKATGKRDFPNLRMEDVQVWHQRWHSLHPETKRWQMACQRQAYEHKRIGVQILSHRKRHFPGGIDKKNAPANHTIQGFAAEIANRGLLRLVEAIPHRGWTPVSGVFLQVHDYIGAYVPRERMWEAKHIVEEALQYEYEGMKFTCTAEASYRWSDQG